MTLREKYKSKEETCIYLLKTANIFKNLAEKQE